MKVIIVVRYMVGNKGEKMESVSLQQIINGLMSISTKGNDTLVMADCIRALAVFSQQLEKAGASVSAVQIPEEEKKEE